jgi:hypothetical protein
MVSIVLPVEHSIIAVSSTSECDIPDDPDESNIAATKNCIVIVCRPASEGDTAIHLATREEVDPRTKAAFVGRILTPNRKIRVWSVRWDALLELSTDADETEVHVWLNHPVEPDEVRIGVA